MKITSNPRFAENSNRSGYILLTTLFIIVMVCMLTIGLARYSMNVASAANSSRRDLQEKWGAASCQRFAIANQSTLLNERVWDDEGEQWRLRPLPRSNVSFELGDVRFDVKLEDESAKLNLNRMFEESGREKTTRLAKRFATQSPLKINLKPLKDRQQRGPIEGAFESWEQVFDSSLPNFRPNNLLVAANKLTCWGSQLNYRSADETVVVETCKPLIGSVLTQELIEILNSDDTSQWQQSLLTAGAKDEQVQELSSILTARSRTQSVWVEALQENRYRAWLVVREEVAGSVYRFHSFTW